MSGLERETLLSGDVVVEEKLDGANLGISLDDSSRIRFQNRGRYLSPPYIAQFSRLQAWLLEHEHDLRAILDPKIVLFGEWCAAVHSIEYTTLPDWFVLFDIYCQREKRFLSVNLRNEIARKGKVATVPALYRGKRDLKDLKEMLLSPSRFSESLLEGIIVRRDSQNWCEGRGKLVRPEFVQSIGPHWSRTTLRWNRRSR